MNSGVVMSEAVVRQAVSNWHVLAVVAVAAAVTFALRYTGVKGADQVSHRPLMQFLSRTMPLGVMVVLVAYTLGDLSADLGRSAALVGAVAITAGLHLWRGPIFDSWYCLLCAASGATDMKSALAQQLG